MRWNHLALPLRRRQALAAVGAAALAALLLGAAPAQAQGRPLAAMLSGGSDPARGDVDGTGTARLELNQGQGRICYELKVRNTAPVSNVRIVETESSRAVALLQNGVGMASRCVQVDKELVKSIRQDHERYSLVVGTSQYPEGALRGGLTLSAAGGADLGAVDWGAVDWGAVDWSAVDWRAVDWSAVDWSAVDISRLDWKQVDLRAVDWDAIDWDAIDWDRIDWEAIDWRKVDWTQIDLRALDWSQVDLSRVPWERIPWGQVQWEELRGLEWEQIAPYFDPSARSRGGDNRGDDRGDDNRGGDNRGGDDRDDD